MNDPKALNYKTPTVVDYGDLQELTAACVGGSGGDAVIKGGYLGGFSIGPSNPAAGCTSNP
jgi:hypothetical protein